MTALDIPGLRAAFDGRLLTDPEDMAPFLTDWRGLWHGAARAVAQPDTAEDVAKIVAWCHARAVPIVPQGGNTGLSGACVPDTSGSAVVLSLTRLNRIREIDPLNDTMIVEAGCILQNVQEAAAEAGRLFPLSLAAEGSCTIGGNLATNAGGTAVLRYGNARELCLGLEVVTSGGQLWNGLRALRKDNTGYDLRALFIGSEGTLGIITAATLKLFPMPSARGVAFAAVPDPAAALRLFDLGRARLGGVLSAFELVPRIGLELVIKHMNGRDPLSGPSPWYVLVEVAGLDDAASYTIGLEDLFAAAFEDDTVTDAVIASSLAQSEALWALREHVSEAQGLEGKTIKHDIAVPISHIAALIEETSCALAAFGGIREVVFGHLGDGNLHYNISPAEGASGDDLLLMQDSINRTVHDIVARHGGSISAEHGLGVLRRDEAARFKSPVEMALMRSIKQALDPSGIMNPGKVLPVQDCPTDDQGEAGFRDVPAFQERQFGQHTEV